MLCSPLSFTAATTAAAAARAVRTTHSAVKMSAGDVVCTGWLIKSPPEKKLKRFVSRSTHYDSSLRPLVSIGIADSVDEACVCVSVYVCVMKWDDDLETFVGLHDVVELRCHSIFLISSFSFL